MIELAKNNMQIYYSRYILKKFISIFIFFSFQTHFKGIHVQLA